MTRHSRSQHSLRAGAAASAAHVTEKADKETPRLRRRALLVLVVAAAALLPAARAAPAATAALLAAPTEPVWIDPCGIQNYTAGNIDMRNAKKALKRLRDYVVGAVNDVSREWQRASGVYRELRKGDFQIDMEWLPRKQFNHYKDNVQGMKLPEKLEHFLQHVHDGVQKYLATAVWLQQDQAADLLLHADQRRRAEFLARIRNRLKSVQCATQEASVQSQAELMVQRPRLLDIVDADAFPQPSQGRAQLLLRDRAFVVRLHAFLKDWQRALNAEMRLLRDKQKPSKPGAAPAGPRRQRHRKKKDQQQKQKQRGA